MVRRWPLLLLLGLALGLAAAWKPHPDELARAVQGLAHTKLGPWAGMLPFKEQSAAWGMPASTLPAAAAVAHEHCVGGACHSLCRHCTVKCTGCCRAATGLHAVHRGAMLMQLPVGMQAGRWAWGPG